MLWGTPPAPAAANQLTIKKLIFLTFFDNFLKYDDIYIYGR